MQVTGADVRLVDASTRQLTHQWRPPAGLNINVASVSPTQASPSTAHVSVFDLDAVYLKNLTLILAFCLTLILIAAHTLACNHSLNLPSPSRTQALEMLAGKCISWMVNSARCLLHTNFAGG